MGHLRVAMHNLVKLKSDERAQVLRLLMVEIRMSIRGAMTFREYNQFYSIPIEIGG